MKDNRFDSRSAFTLVEMLFVIAIIAVLSSLAYGVMAEAQQDAQASATKSRIAQIESIMQIAMEDFEVRRLPIRNAELIQFILANRIGSGANQVPVGVQLKNLRRRIMLDMVKSEFATAYVDGTFQLAPNPSLGRFPGEIRSVGLTAPFDQSFREWLDDTYSNQVSGILLSDYLASRKSAEIEFWSSWSTLNTALPASILARNALLDQPGEYLYLELARINIDGSTALEMLGPRAVGDPDGDGLLDIVDAFGDSMGLKILQVQPDLTLTDTTTDTWAFQETNWANRSGSDLLPTGYQIATSVVPSPISSIRIQVVSPRLESRGEQ